MFRCFKKDEYHAQCLLECSSTIDRFRAWSCDIHDPFTVHGGGNALSALFGGNNAKEVSPASALTVRRVSHSRMVYPFSTVALVGYRILSLAIWWRC